MTARKEANIHFGSRTDIGCQRQRNEDSLVVNPPLFVVADGMGGHAAGDVASEVAVNTMSALAPDTPDVDLLGRAVQSANHAVITESQKAGHQGMGTTMTACVVQHDKIAIAHVGDSRAYLLHAGKLQQITRDHSWIADMVEQGRITPEEARIHPKRSVITRALGSDPHMQPDLYEITASAGDRLLLCSDGLHGMVEDDDIQAMMARIRDPQQCAESLVNEAIAAGGADNITVIVVDIAGDDKKIERRERRRGRAWMAVVLVALLAIFIGAAFGVSTWIHNTAYLAEQDGKVVIYQGIPEEFPGIETHWLYKETGISIDKLQPSAQSHIREGLRVDSVQQAEHLVTEYERQIKEDEAQEMAKGKTPSPASSSASSASIATTSSSAASSTSSTSSTASASAGASSGKSGSSGGDSSHE